MLELFERVFKEVCFHSKEMTTARRSLDLLPTNSTSIFIKNFIDNQIGPLEQKTAAFVQKTSATVRSLSGDGARNASERLLNELVSVYLLAKLNYLAVSSQSLKIASFKKFETVLGKEVGLGVRNTPAPFQEVRDDEFDSFVFGERPTQERVSSLDVEAVTSFLEKTKRISRLMASLVEKLGTQNELVEHILQETEATTNNLEIANKHLLLMEADGVGPELYLGVFVYFLVLLLVLGV